MSKKQCYAFIDDDEDHTVLVDGPNIARPIEQMLERMNDGDTITVKRIDQTEEEWESIDADEVREEPNGEPIVVIAKYSEILTWTGLILGSLTMTGLVDIPYIVALAPLVLESILHLSVVASQSVSKRLL